MKKFVIIVEAIIIVALLVYLFNVLNYKNDIVVVEPYDYEVVRANEYSIVRENFTANDVVFVEVENVSGKMLDTAKITIEDYGYFTYIQYLAPNEKRFITIDTEWGERPTETLKFVVTDFDYFTE